MGNKIGDNPTICIMVGLPRSGKSTWIGKTRNKEVIISADRLRLEMYGQRFFSGGEAFVWATRDVLLKIILDQGLDIIIDDTNITIERRKNIIKLAKKYGYNVSCIFINTPSEVCISRAIDTEQHDLIPVIENMNSLLELPTMEEGIDIISTYNF